MKGANQIDWRMPFQTVKEFLEGDSGILQVRAGTHSAGPTFMKVIRQRLEIDNFLTIEFRAGEYNRAIASSEGLHSQ